jgi:hypothetical protein
MIARAAGEMFAPSWNFADAIGLRVAALDHKRIVLCSRFMIPSARRRGPVDEALNAAAEEIANGKPAANAKQRAYEAIRAAVREALS